MAEGRKLQKMPSHVHDGILLCVACL